MFPLKKKNSGNPFHKLAVAWCLGARLYNIIVMIVLKYIFFKCVRIIYYYFLNFIFNISILKKKLQFIFYISILNLFYYYYYFQSF